MPSNRGNIPGGVQSYGVQVHSRYFPVNVLYFLFFVRPRVSLVRPEGIASFVPTLQSPQCDSVKKKKSSVIRKNRVRKVYNISVNAPVQNSIGFEQRTATLYYSTIGTIYVAYFPSPHPPMNIFGGIVLFLRD